MRRTRRRDRASLWLFHVSYERRAIFITCQIIGRWAITGEYFYVRNVNSRELKVRTSVNQAFLKDFRLW